MGSDKVSDCKVKLYNFPILTVSSPGWKAWNWRGLNSLYSTLPSHCRRKGLVKPQYRVTGSVTKSNIAVEKYDYLWIKHWSMLCAQLIVTEYKSIWYWSWYYSVLLKRTVPVLPCPPHPLWLRVPPSFRPSTQFKPGDKEVQILTYLVQASMRETREGIGLFLPFFTDLVSVVEGVVGCVGVGEPGQVAG